MAAFTQGCNHSNQNVVVKNGVQFFILGCIRVMLRGFDLLLAIKASFLVNAVSQFDILCQFNFWHLCISMTNNSKVMEDFL